MYVFLWVWYTERGSDSTQQKQQQPHFPLRDCLHLPNTHSPSILHCAPIHQLIHVISLGLPLLTLTGWLIGCIIFNWPQVVQLIFAVKWKDGNQVCSYSPGSGDKCVRWCALHRQTEKAARAGAETAAFVKWFPCCPMIRGAHLNIYGYSTVLHCC